MSTKVYFSKNITPEMVLELYKMVGKELNGNVAVKLHSGEKGNQNFLKPGLLCSCRRSLYGRYWYFGIHRPDCY